MNLKKFYWIFENNSQTVFNFRIWKSFIEFSKTSEFCFPGKTVEFKLKLEKILQNWVVSKAKQWKFIYAHPRKALNLHFSTSCFGSTQKENKKVKLKNFKKPCGSFTFTNWRSSVVNYSLWSTLRWEISKVFSRRKSFLIKIVQTSLWCYQKSFNSKRDFHKTFNFAWPLLRLS